MSSRGRAASGYTPDPNGFYQTPESATCAILPHLGIRPGMVIVEPGCGKGAIARVLRREFRMSIDIIGIEIDAKRAQAAKRAKVSLPPQDNRATGGKFDPGGKAVVFDEVIRADLFQVKRMDLPTRIDLCLTNPSFSIWLKTAEWCFAHAPCTTLLIPWNSAASKKRAPWWKLHPAYMRLLSRRPSFAISVKCEMTNGKRARAAGVSVCSFQEMIPIDETPKKICPECGARTTTTSSDSNEYCWAQWAPDITFNRWDPLETPEVADKQTEAAE